MADIADDAKVIDRSFVRDTLAEGVRLYFAPIKAVGNILLIASDPGPRPRGADSHDPRARDPSILAGVIVGAALASAMAFGGVLAALRALSRLVQGL